MFIYIYILLNSKVFISWNAFYLIHNFKSDTKENKKCLSGQFFGNPHRGIFQSLNYTRNLLQGQ